MRSLLIALVAALGVTLAGGGLEARADGRAPAPSQGGANAAASVVAAEVIVLHATNDGSGIDAKIGKIPALSKPPFSAYNSYKLLARESRSMEKGKSTTIKLPTGRELMVTFKDVILPKKQDEAKKFVVTASIQKPDGKSFLPLLEVNAKAGEWFFVGGQEYKSGSLVIGVKVNP